MKVLTICHDHPEFTAGGTEYAAHDLTQALNAMPGVKARFLAATSALTHPEADPGSLHALGDDLLLRTGSYDMFSMRRHDGKDWIAALERVLVAFEPDLVHLHGLDRIGVEVLPVLRRLRPRLRLILTLHDYQLICPNDGLLIRRSGGGLCQRPSADACRQCFPELAAGRHALRKANLLQSLELVDAFVTPSRAVGDRFVQWGLAGDRITVLPNAVPTMEPLRPEVPRARRDRFAYFGNMAQHKGTHVLCDAAARLAVEDAALTVTLHGQLHHPSAEAASQFESGLARAAPVLSHLGPYNRNEVGALMQQTDWVVVPSVWEENAPLVVLEAQRAGRPVICTRLGGLSELVRDGVDGLHVPRGNAAALAQTMLSAASDPDLWSQLSAQIRPPMTPEVHARRHLSVYAEHEEYAVA